MSGGHFDYFQYRINDVANHLDEKLEDIARYEFNTNTVDRLNEAAHELHRAAAMLQRVDWLLCGDDGEDSFHERWETEVPGLYQSALPDTE